MLVLTVKPKKEESVGSCLTSTAPLSPGLARGSHEPSVLVKENKNGSRRRQRTLYFLKRNFMSSCEMKLDAILYVWNFTSQDKWCGGWV